MLVVHDIYQIHAPKMVNVMAVISSLLNLFSEGCFPVIFYFVCINR